MLLNVFFITGSYHGEKLGLHEPPITAHKGRQIFGHTDTEMNTELDNTLTCLVVHLFL